VGEIDVGAGVLPEDEVPDSGLNVDVSPRTSSWYTRVPGGESWRISLRYSSERLWAFSNVEPGVTMTPPSVRSIHFFSRLWASGNLTRGVVVTRTRFWAMPGSFCRMAFETPCDQATSARFQRPSSSSQPPA